MRDDPHLTSIKNSLELIELSRMLKVSLVLVSSCSNTGSIRDDLYWTGLELIELSSLPFDLLLSTMPSNLFH